MDNWLRNNNVIRVVAVLVGILLWVIVRLDVQNSSGPSQPTTISQTYTNVAVQVVGLDEDRLTLMSYEPQRVTLTVIGTASSLRRVSGDYRVLLNLTDVQPGEQLVSLTHEGFPANVQVVLDPPNVAVVIDEKERKELPVTIEVAGEPAQGYLAGEPIVQPNRVNVTVESSVADRVASVVGVVDIAGAKQTVKREVRLAALGPDGEELDVPISPAVVEVEVPVTLPFKTVPLQISLDGDTPPGLAVESFTQSAAEVKVYAPQEILDRISFYEGPRIDLSRLNRTQTFEFDLPEMDGVERVEPAEVSATVTIADAEVVTFGEVPIVLNGAREGFTYSAGENDAGTMAVSLEAAPSVAAGLTADDVTASVEVGMLPPGEYELPVVFSLPVFAELAEDTPRIVRVVVTEEAEDASTEPSGDATGDSSGESSGDSSEWTDDDAAGGSAGEDEESGAGGGEDEEPSGQSN